MSRTPPELIRMHSRTTTRAVFSRLLRDETGQDVIEYALLGALIGIASILTWQQIAARTGVVYGEADAGVQGISACTPDPGGGGCP